MKQDRYAFPAIFFEEKEGISIEFPDLPGCISCASTFEEARENACEVLGLYLYGMEQDGENIPKPSSPESVDLPEGATIYIAEAYMPDVRKNMRDVFVKVTVSLPAYLIVEAQRAGIDLSETLQNALKKELGLR